MDILLVVLALLCGVIGLLGSVVPILPGPPVAFVGLLLIHWSKYARFEGRFLLLFLLLTVVVTVVDNILPVWMTKKYGGSRTAVRGSLAGLIVGMFFGPWGLVLGAFVGAFLGELIHNGEDVRKALRVGFGSFVAFLFGTGAKLALSAVMLFYIVRPLFSGAG